MGQKLQILRNRFDAGERAIRKQAREIYRAEADIRTKVEDGFRSVPQWQPIIFMLEDLGICERIGTIIRAEAKTHITDRRRKTKTDYPFAWCESRRNIAGIDPSHASNKIGHARA